jgi:hypothetical protein
MAFTVPNRPDAGIAADQAEPDSGDFQTLGYQKTGVLSGGAVAKLAANTVRVGAITGYLNGEYFEVAETDRGSFSVPSTGSSKFVLILVQKNASGDFIVYDHQGDAGNNGQSATNARYPDDVDYTTKMLLATVYYADGDAAIGTNAIVDKRVFILPQANPSVIAAAPASTTAGAIGEIKIDSSVTSGNGTSNVWIKTAASTWTNLGTAVTVSHGQDADPATITVGTVLTGDPGTQVLIGSSGTPSARILDFTIPRGARGEDGDDALTSSWGLQANSGESVIVSDGVVNFTGGGDTSVTRTGNTITVTSTPTTSSYSFKVTEGAFSPQSPVNSGAVLMIYGGNDITVTRNGTYFTIDWDGAGTYLPLSAGTAYPLSGGLMTEHLHPHTHDQFRLGSWSNRYKTAYLVSAPDVSSDLRLKEEITESPGLGLVNRLKPLSYRLKATPDKKHWGFGAQDVYKVCGPDSAVVSVSDEGPQGIAYTELMAPMVKAIQELSERLEAIENG